mmetsp:Transcript_6343/g.11034  ORF Transcript_6343/g.11034 Transcript_6343/m.11034 type:complete len:82 (-) Transcript_6343:201-446(-)
MLSTISRLFSCNAELSQLSATCAVICAHKGSQKIEPRLASERNLAYNSYWRLIALRILELLAIPFLFAEASTRDLMLHAAG